MAEGDLCVNAQRILGLLGSEDIKKICSLWRVPQELLRGLEGTISKLAPLLLDAEKKSFGDGRLEDWLRWLGETLKNAENLLDDLSTAALSHRLLSSRQKMAKVMKQVCRTALFSTSSNPVTTSDYRFKVLNEMKEIKTKLDEIASHRHEFLLEECSNDGQFQALVPAERESSTPSFIVKEDDYGRRDDKEAIVKLLLDHEFQEDAIMVLPIVGIGGLGKTTLARDVFDDRRVIAHFEQLIWVWVSDDQHFDIRNIVGKICASAAASGRSTENLTTEQLHGMLKESLHGRRYLIVLDDVWNVDHSKWAELKDILRFVGARSGNAIILTSRSLKVARIAGTMEPYELRLLTEEQSWTLFQRIAFRHQASKETQFSRMKYSKGVEIVRQCYGHPHLIWAIGNFLWAKEKTGLDWLFFYEVEFSSTKRYIILEKTLKPSYDHLSSPLKHCFAYCCLFQKNHEIDVQTLIQLWMAQGFIHPATSKDQSLEDVGYGHVIDLLDTYFFHEVTKDARGRVTKCKMHVLMHDLATYVAGGQCLRLDSQGVLEDTHGRVSHVSFGFPLTLTRQVPASLKGAEKLRSLLFRSNSWKADTGRSAEKNLDATISGCRFLRVLDMHDLGITNVPSSIGKLKHLRYLDLSENELITELPDSISELLNLQTLKLSSCFELRKLPRDIGNLINLRHLETDGCYNLVSLPRGITRLTNLQALSQVVLSEDASMRRRQLKQLGRLKNLRGELVIKNLKHGEDEVATYLKEKSGVRSLSLEWGSQNLDKDEKSLDSELFSDLEELALNGFRGEALFRPSFPRNLVKLSLRRWVKGKNLSSLSQCLKLKVLVLDEISDLESVTNDPFSPRVAFFPALQELWLTELRNLRGWWSPNLLENQKYLPSFPCLSKLVIEDCPKLASMPLFPTLEEGLVLDSTCWNSFQLTVENKLATTTADEASSSSNVPSPPLSKLKSLCIVGIDKFGDSNANKIAWDTLQSLRLLKFDSLPQLTTLPQGLQHVSNLKELHLWRSGVKEIPAWIGQLKFLEKLVIRSCPMLKSLPEIKYLRLKTLEIEDCPTLIRRCEEGIGADWDKIKHIPDLRLGR